MRIPNEPPVCPVGATPRSRCGATPRTGWRWTCGAGRPVEVGDHVGSCAGDVARRVGGRPARRDRDHAGDARLRRRPRGGVIEPLGSGLARMPASSSSSENAGTIFELSRSVTPLPHRQQAWIVFRTLVELTAHAERLSCARPTSTWIGRPCAGGPLLRSGATSHGAAPFDRPLITPPSAGRWPCETADALAASPPRRRSRRPPFPGGVVSRTRRSSPWRRSLLDASPKGCR